MASRVATRASWSCVMGHWAAATRFFYAVGTYTCANGKWKGEVTNQEHSPTFGARPVWERKVVTIGFSGTYDDVSAETHGMALAGKQSIRFKSRLRLLVPD